MKAICLVLLTTFTAFANIYEYKLAHFPTDKATCPFVAKALGQKLAEQTGVLIVQTYCSKESSETGFGIIANYEADRPLKLVSTYREYRASQAGYYSNKECLAAIESEENLFRKATGLKPFLSFCYAEAESSQHTSPYGLRIDAFGEPLFYPFTTRAALRRGQLVGDKRAFAEELRHKLSNGQLFISTVAILDEVPHNSIVVRYYARKIFYLDVKLLSPYNDVNYCTQQLITAASAFSLVTTPPLGLMCTFDELIASHFYSVSIYPTHWKTLIPIDRFQSMDECLAEKPKLLKNNEAVYNQELVGGFCGFDQSSELYHVVMILKQRGEIISAKEQQ